MRIGVAAVALVLLAIGCGSNDEKPENEGAAALEVTRSDGSRVTFPSDEVHAWCEREDDAEGETTGPLELFVLGGLDLPYDHSIGPDTYWMFSRRTDRIERKPGFDLPDDDDDQASFFVYDRDTDNELSSSEEEAKGTVTVEEWGCGKGDEVRISVDATLGSELHDLPSAEAQGTIAAIVGKSQSLSD